MKHKITFSIYFSCQLLLFSINLTYSQKSFESHVMTVNDSKSFKGIYLPEKGLIHALIIFIQFPDDTITYSSWQRGKLPPGARGIISSINLETYPEGTLSDYFRKMSNGSQNSGLNLTGNIFDSLILVPSTVQSYIDSGKNYGDVNRDVLIWLVNNTSIDFSLYDNWTFEDECHHNNQSDGRVDMIYMIYRNINPELLYGYGNFSGIAQLGEGQENLFTNNYTRDGKRVYISFANLLTGGASGVTINRSWVDFNVITHEFCHYLFGALHHIGSGIMGQYYKPAMSSIEREYLDYMSIKEINQSEISISDYLTTNKAYKYKISDNEYFILENHQKFSFYDGVGGSIADKKKGKGLYIFHLKGNFDTEIECADGKWDWKIECYFKNIFPPYQELPMYRKLLPNPWNGKNKLEIGKSFDGDCSHPVYTGEDQGDDGNAYKIGYNQVFSPWSNPNSHSFDNKFLNFAMEIINQTDSNIKVRIYSGNAKDAQPSKPQFIKASNESQNETLLQWFLNSEPDLKGYNIYRAEIYQENEVRYKKLNNKLIKDTLYIDRQISNQYKFSSIGYYFSYRISAVDNQNKESVLSDECRIRLK